MIAASQFQSRMEIDRTKPSSRADPQLIFPYVRIQKIFLRSRKTGLLTQED